MALAQPSKAWRFAFLTTLFSVLGGIFGYLIGYFSFDFIEPLLHQIHWHDKYILIRGYFEEYGVWIVLAAGFTFIPYKIFTITAGVMHMNPVLFILASLVGRGARFYIVAGCMVLGGEKLEKSLRKYIDVITWGTIALVIVLIIILTI